MARKAAKKVAKPEPKLASVVQSAPVEKETKSVPVSNHQIVTYNHLMRQKQILDQQIDMLFEPSNPFPQETKTSHKLKGNYLVFTKED